jgi:hypothetical protein
MQYGHDWLHLREVSSYSPSSPESDGTGTKSVRDIRKMVGEREYVLSEDSSGKIGKARTK